MNRRLVAPALIVVAAAAGGFAGALIGVPELLGAQETTTTLPAPPDVKIKNGPPEIAAAAKALNLSTDQLLEKLKDGKTTIADVAKQQGVDIDTVIDAMVGADRDRIKDMVNNPLRRFGDHDGPGRPGFGHRFGFGKGGGELDAAAKAIGITTDELFTELRKGTSIADVAKSKNVDAAKVIDAMVAAVETRIAEAQKNGRLTQDQADALKKNVKDHITAMVNGTLPKPGFGFRDGRHRFPGAPGAVPEMPQPDAAL
jgi:hypothetical protein